MVLTLQPHQYEKIPGQGMQMRLARVVPYLRIRHSTDPPLFIQKGEVYTDDGEEVKELPEWFWDEARKCSPAARAEVGLVLPEEKSTAANSASPSGNGEPGVRPAPGGVTPSPRRGRPRKEA